MKRSGCDPSGLFLPSLVCLYVLNQELAVANTAVVGAYGEDGADDVIQIMTATGAGLGDPKQRDQTLVLEDLKNGYISVAQARSPYGLDVRAE